jgi:hypothetical protein
MGRVIFVPIDTNHPANLFGDIRHIVTPWANFNDEPPALRVANRLPATWQIVLKGRERKSTLSLDWLDVSART